MLKTILGTLIQIGLRNAARKRKRAKKAEMEVRGKNEVREKQNPGGAGTDGNGTRAATRRPHQQPYGY